jgi:hypothetical protein
LPAIDDRSGIQFALAQVLALIASDQIDHKRSGRILNGLFIASRNLQRELRPTSLRRGSSQSMSDETSSDSASVNLDSNPLVDELILDSDLGPIAPVAEAPAIKDVEEERSKHFAAMLDDLIHPKPEPASNPTSAILPTLQAVAEPQPYLPQPPRASNTKPRTCKVIQWKLHPKRSNPRQSTRALSTGASRSA